MDDVIEGNMYELADQPFRVSDHKFQEGANTNESFLPCYVEASSHDASNAE